MASSKQDTSEILQSLTERDEQDLLIDEQNRKSLQQAGLKVFEPKKIISIDTGEVVGVSNVVKKIIQEIGSEDVFISLEGLSGTGKSATAEMLTAQIQAIKFSMGEIFRYLTFLSLQNEHIDFSQAITGLHYKFKNSLICLCDRDRNITQDIGPSLRSPSIEKILPKISGLIQKEVIKFVSKEISELRDELSDKKILLEGRSFTLDFLPSDVRIKLCADPVIRAERRLEQIHK